MIKTKKWVYLGIFCFIFLPHCLFGNAFSSVVEKASPCVVHIRKDIKQTRVGSGIIVSSNGYILTNQHVVEGTTDIKIILFDKREFKGTIIGSDPKTDIALIKIDAKDLPAISFGNSDQIRVGDWAIAIGSPIQLSNTVTVGIISGKGRSRLGIAESEDFIQTDAAINPGNSGGPLLNIDGELIGINTAIAAPGEGYTGIGFAIPVNLAIKVMKDLQKEGRVIYGWIGVTVQSITEDLQKQFKFPNQRGALVSDVAPGSPADKAGILRGDIIVKYQNSTIDEADYLNTRVAQTTIGELVVMEIIRKNVKLEIRAVVKPIPSQMDEVKNKASEIFGLTVDTITPEFIKKYRLKHQNGVVITALKGADSTRYSSLKEGDIILEIQQGIINSVDDYYDMIKDVQKGSRLLLTIQRNESVFFTVIEVN